METQQLIAFRDPQNSDYNTRFTVTEGVISPLAFPDVAVTVATIVSL